MIHIEKDAEILENENLRVVTTTGDYEDSALIEFVDISNPGVVAGAYQAQYIKYGNLVYRFNDHKELGTEILKIDPSSTHTSASFVRMSNELLAQMDSGSLEPSSLDEVLAVEQVTMEEQMTNSVESESATSTESAVDNSPVITPTDTSTTTPPFSSDTSTSTSPAADTSVSTTTPFDTSTTTLVDTIETSSDSTATSSTP